jgi:hypothetical protein
MTTAVVKARVTFFIIWRVTPLSCWETAICGFRCPHHWQATPQAANADFVPPDAGKA